MCNIVRDYFLYISDQRSIGIVKLYSTVASVYQCGRVSYPTPRTLLCKNGSIVPVCRL